MHTVQLPLCFASLKFFLCFIPVSSHYVPGKGHLYPSSLKLLRMTEDDGRDVSPGEMPQIEGGPVAAVSLWSTHQHIPAWPLQEIDHNRPGRLPWGWQRLCPQGWAYLSDKTGGICPHCPLLSARQSNFVNQHRAAVRRYSAFVGIRKGCLSEQIQWLDSACWPPFVWSVSYPQSLARMLSITAEVSSLSPPYLKFLCCVAFSFRAFIFLSDLITQCINSDQDVNSGGYSRHAVVSPVLFSLSRILSPELTSAKNPIHFARLKSNINYSVEKNPDTLIWVSFLLWMLVVLDVLICFLTLLNKYFRISLP